MKKIMFIGLVIVGIIPTLHARKIGCQFEAIRQKIDDLTQNATDTWKAIKKLNKQLVKHEEKMFMKEYSYKNPYINAAAVRKIPATIPIIEIEDIQNDDDNTEVDDIAIINALQNLI